MASLCVCARHFSVATKMSKHFLIFSFLTKKDLEDIEKAIPFMKSKEQELAVKLNETLDVLLKAFDLSITTSSDEENSLHKEFRSFLSVVKNMTKEEYDMYNTRLTRNYLGKREKQRRTREEQV